MKFYILDNGWETLDKSYFIAGANAATASDRNPVNEWIDIPIQAYLITSEYGNILFDTDLDRQHLLLLEPSGTRQDPLQVASAV